MNGLYYLNPGLYREFRFMPGRVARTRAVPGRRGVGLAGPARGGHILRVRDVAQARNMTETRILYLL